MSGNGLIGGLSVPTYKAATGCWRPSKIAREQLSAAAIASGAKWPIMADPSYASTTGLWQFNEINGTYPDRSAVGTNVASPLTGWLDGAHSKFSNFSLRKNTGVAAGAVTVTSDVGFNFGSGDYTWEGFIYPNTASGNQVIVDQRAGADGLKVLVYMSGTTLIFHFNGTTRISGTAIIAGQWQHWHLSRISSVTQLGVDGVQVGSNYSDSNTYIQSGIIFGCASDGSSPADAWFGPHRVTKGVGRYSGTYTVPGIFPEY